MKSALRFFLISGVVLLISTQAAPVPNSAVRPVAGVECVAIVSLDGLRPDLLLLAEAPTLRRLLRTGAYSMWARTTAVAVTLPSHTSMLTGVSPNRHGIEWNTDLPLRIPVFPNVPTIFEIGTKAGLICTLVAGKSKMSVLNKPGTVAHAFLPSGKDGNNAFVVTAAQAALALAVPDIGFFHFPDIDATGHANGWGSPEQLASIAATDAQLSAVLAAYERAGALAKTVFIITSDHGGAGRGHGHVGPDDGRSRFIPWIVHGPGVRAGFDLTQLGRLQIDTEDTAATVCWLLGLPLLPHLEGKPIRDAFVTK